MDNPIDVPARTVLVSFAKSTVVFVCENSTKRIHAECVQARRRSMRE